MQLQTIFVLVCLCLWHRVEETVQHPNTHSLPPKHNRLRSASTCSLNQKFSDSHGMHCLRTADRTPWHGVLHYYTDLEGPLLLPRGASCSGISSVYSAQTYPDREAQVHDLPAPRKDTFSGAARHDCLNGWPTPDKVHDRACTTEAFCMMPSALGLSFACIEGLPMVHMPP